MTDESVGCIIHISPSEKREGIPELGQEKPCKRGDCKGSAGWDMGYGLAGGGMGAYVYCEVCEQILSKTVDPEEQA